MGGRGASSGVSDKGKPYGSEYTTLYQSGNIKFIQSNSGNATASEVMQLICDVQKKVKEQTGVDLEPEVMLTGR